MSELKSLVQKRKYFKGRLTRINKYLEDLKVKYPNYVVDDEIEALEFNRLTNWKDLSDSFQQINIKIVEACDDSNEEQYLNEIDEIESNIQAAINKSNKFKVIGNILTSQSSSPSNENKDIDSGEVNLPKIDIIKFNGNFNGWLEFRNTFESLINKNSKLGAVQKFHYLKASLSGSALQVIEGLDFTKENYDIAWTLITNRFNDNKVLINNHVKALFNLEQIKQESSVALREIVDAVNKHLVALKSLKEPTEYWDTLIVHLIASKLDSVTDRAWEEKLPLYDKPTLHDLKEFLKSQANLLERVEAKRNQSKAVKNIPKLRHEPIKVLQTSTISSFCPVCKSDQHAIKHCPQFLKLNPSRRRDTVKGLKLCLNCLRSGHISRFCRSGTCFHCRKYHNSLLHEQINENAETSHRTITPSSSTDVTAASGSSSNQIINLVTNCYNLNQGLLATAVIKVADSNHDYHLARVLLDPGSQVSFITEALFKVLDLPTETANLTVCGFGLSESKANKKTQVTIQSRINNYKTNVNCYVTSQITGTIPNTKIELGQFNIPNHIILADPSFNVPQKIDMLIGADCFWQILCIGQINLSQKGPTLKKTRFGWVIGGPISNTHKESSAQCNLITNQGLSNQIAQFWEVEEISVDKFLSDEEGRCEEHFLKTLKREPNGRFVVSLPFKRDPEVLGESYSRAEKRFYSLEAKFARNSQFKTEYVNFINEYKALNHMVKINNDVTTPCYYMPHHGVIKESSFTTRLRVVFDCSSQTSSGFSLNNIQLVGPALQQDLLSILVRFRQHNYVIAADIEKMYRMINIEPTQRSLQRILWRDDPSQPIETYELNTVTYGTSSAPFLAIRCLMQLGEEAKLAYPHLAEIIKRDFYVDDLLTGAETIQEAIRIANGVSQILQGGCFKLRKWVSNNSELLQGIEGVQTSKVIEFGVDQNTKTLGLLWDSQSDTLMYRINLKHTNQVTKRAILSEVSQIFDPLGLLSPCIIVAKIMLQKLWSEGLTWDQTLPSHLQTKWLSFRRDLINLNQIRIKRQIVCKNPIHMEVHAFSDASQDAYGSCVYLRTTNELGEIFTKLIIGKSKVAPLKVLSIPRLELCAALLSAKLVQRVINSLNLNIDRITYWTDSTIVLGWLNTQPNQLQTFVANRVVTIQELTKNVNWRHVPGTDNPADYISRGVSPSILYSLELYWYGPSWLKNPENKWPNTHVNQETLPEIKRLVNINQIIDSQCELFNTYSCLGKLQRVMAYCLRFTHNCRNNSRDHGPLTAKEIKNALMCLAKISQRESFKTEINLLIKDKAIDSKSKLLKLNPFMDEDGFLRVGGRLVNSSFKFHKKHPIVICSKHPFAKLLFRKEHKRLLHAGPQHLLSIIRENFWPISGRNLARKIVHECIRCFKCKPEIAKPIMGNLPKSRLEPTLPFHITGVDYAGPFLVKDRQGRGCKTSKCYICLFICFTTRAIHLELVSDLTKDAFIAALRRFVARRGKPAQIYSDNGTNFIGANAELKELGKFLVGNSTDLTENINNQDINWSFIPSHSPHFGGLWEAGVKSTKHHLRRVAGDAILTYECFYTILVQVEAILNSRPLSPLSSDPSDLAPLTPAHFLIGGNATQIADPDLRNIKINRLSQFQRCQQIQQHFWERWSKEYISELQERTKWRKQHNDLKVDDLVIIKEDNQPPLKWPLGRIVHIHPGRDKVARVATIKTSGGIVKRSFAKICPLPMISDSERQ